jgi:hypothetical protein
VIGFLIVVEGESSAAAAVRSIEAAARTDMNLMRTMVTVMVVMFWCRVVGSSGCEVPVLYTSRCGLWKWG